MSELVVLAGGNTSEVLVTSEDKREADSVRTLFESAGTRLFAKEHTSPLLSQAQDTLADALVSEMVGQAVRSELQYQYESQIVNHSGALTSKIDIRTDEILKALSFDVTQSRKDALESTREYVVDNLALKAMKTGFARHLNSKQLDRIEELATPFIATGLLEKARVRLYELGFAKSKQHDGFEMNEKMADSLAAIISTIDQKSNSFADKEAREQALAELKTAVKSLVFDERKAWLSNDVQEFDRKSVDAIVGRYFYYRNANVYDTFVPYGADGVRHVSWSRVGAATTAVLLLGLVGCALYGSATPPPVDGSFPVTPDDDDHKTPTATFTPEVNYWAETALIQSEPLASWQTIPAIGLEAPFIRVSTDAVNYPDGSVKLYQPESGGSQRYALGFSTFTSLDPKVGSAFAPTIFYGEDASEVGMLGDPAQLDENTREWKVMRMVGQNVEVDSSFRVIFQKVGEGFTFTIKMANGDLIPLTPEAPQSDSATPMVEPTTIPAADYNAIFQPGKPQLKFEGDGPPGATEFNTERGLWQNAEGKFYIAELQTWTEALNKNKIYLIDTSVAPSWFTDGLSKEFQSFPVDYYRLPGAEAIFNSFEQSPGYTEQYSQDQDLQLSVYPHQSMFAWHLGARTKNHPVTWEDPSEVNAALKAMQKGDLLLPLDIPKMAYDNSNTTTKSFDPNLGLVIVQVPFSLTEGDSSYFGNQSQLFRWKVDVINNRLVEYISMQGSFSAQDKAFLPQIPLAAAMLGQQLPTFESRGFNTQEANNFLHSAEAQGVSLDEYNSLADRFSFLLDSGSLVSNEEKAAGQTIPFLQVK